jgi:uncharacterized protein (DUF2126 family)
LESTIALHPNIGVDVPLVFDLVDTWNNKVIGGCTYFVNHPGGRSFDTYPVALKQNRENEPFLDFGHTPSTSIEVREIEKKRYQIKLRLLDFL